VGFQVLACHSGGGELLKPVHQATC
jgi:hypothetical protein